MPGGPGGFPQNSSCSAVLRIPSAKFVISRTGLSPSMMPLSRGFHYHSSITYDGPTTPRCMHLGLGSSHFARRYFGNLCRFLFLRVLRCFTSPGLPRKYAFPILLIGGLPHSDISGSKHASCSPKRFVGSYVLHRLLVPRHPPCALNILPKIF